MNFDLGLMSPDSTLSEEASGSSVSGEGSADTDIHATVYISDLAS